MDTAGTGDGGSYGGTPGGPTDRGTDVFRDRAQQYHRDTAVNDMAAALEDVATHLDYQSRNLRSAARTIRDQGSVHMLETVVRELMWLNTKLGIDRFFVLYGEYSRNFDQ